MIRSVQSTTSTDATTQAQAAGVKPATTAAKKFADVHKAAVAKQAGGDAHINVPEGETWAPVNGDAHYARIITGPRVGKYINLTHGDRRGEIFTIEQKDGKAYHVYDSGSVLGSQDEQKVKGKSAKLAARVAADQPPKGETWAPVDGHNHYADILSGKRNGLYVNTSGGVRDGMAFQIVKHGAKTFHVYGSGKDRQVIEIGAHKKADSSTPTATPTTGSTGATQSTTSGTTPSGDTSISTNPQ